MKGLDVLTAALERSADRFYTVPGYPVSDLAERLGAEMVINEKVGLEYALGDSIAGRRAALIIKNVGINSCADPLVNATTQGLKAGVVIVAGDDVNVMASQNAQDSRYFGEIAQIPVLEPDGATMGQTVEEAFSVSEHFSRIALLRFTPPVLEGEAGATIRSRKSGSGNLADRRLTMRGRVERADSRIPEMFAWSRGSFLNRYRGGTIGAGGAPGDSHVVTIYPPPTISGDLVVVNEYGRPFLQEHRCIAPPEKAFTPETYMTRGFYRTFCPGCPFHPVMKLLADRKLSAVCDMGCSLLAMNPPYEIGIATYGLGSSIGVAARSTGIALCGDFALLHSGINALIDVYEKALPLLCIILDNRRMGMTGGHAVPEILPYIKWAHPEVIDACDEGALRGALELSNTPRTLIITGICPEGEEHETVEC